MLKLKQEGKKMVGHYGYTQMQPFSRNVGPDDVVGNLRPCSRPCPTGDGADAPFRDYCMVNKNPAISDSEKNGERAGLAKIRNQARNARYRARKRVGRA